MFDELIIARATNRACLESLRETASSLAPYHDLARVNQRVKACLALLEANDADLRQKLHTETLTLEVSREA